MRILFFTWRSTLRRFVDVVSELSARGCEVVVAAPAQKARALPRELAGVAGVEAVSYPEVADERAGQALALLRHVRDYVWYLSPEQRTASFNRGRALERLVRTASGGRRQVDPSWPDPLVELPPGDRATIDAALGAIDARIRPDPGVVELIRSQRPDAVLVSPLLKQTFHQTEVVKAARSLGVPSGFLVYSWDNLSNKGRVHVPPDRTFVWNELQRGEAVGLHGLDPESVRVVGAPHWDRFFARSPSSSREELCAQHGFDPERPIVLYLGSTTRICPDETVVVERWLEAVRAAPGALREANVLVRPHPDEKKLWKQWRPRGERVSLSRNPHQQDQSLYDDLYHAAAAVGLNTSAQIEASILGRPVFTFAAGELAPGQEGTLHFHYLLRDTGGVVVPAATPAEHAEQLERALAGDYDREAITRFCETFVRPRGLDRPVAPLLADEIVALAGSGARQAGRLTGAGAERS
jgi:hypothetical protein